MRILITNDDGINAPGLVTLARIAAEIAGPEGEVWTVAPAFEQSGVGHCISYTHPMINAKLGDRRYAVEGSPADCVLAGVYAVLDGAKPDLVLRPDFTFSDEEYNTYACPWHHNITTAIASFRTAKALRTNSGSRFDIGSFRWHNSTPFEWHSQQLMDLGLMEPGQWF